MHVGGGRERGMEKGLPFAGMVVVMGLTPLRVGLSLTHLKITYCSPAQVEAKEKNKTRAVIHAEMQQAVKLMGLFIISVHPFLMTTMATL